MGRTRKGKRKFISCPSLFCLLQDSVPDEHSIEIHQTGRNIGLARNREDCLSQPTFLQQRQNLARATQIKLREGIVEEKERLNSRMLSQSRGLEHAQRDRCRALLTR